jgi:hypothetical protein
MSLWIVPFYLDFHSDSLVPLKNDRALYLRELIALFGQATPLQFQRMAPEILADSERGLREREAYKRFIVEIQNGHLWEMLRSDLNALKEIEANVVYGVWDPDEPYLKEEVDALRASITDLQAELAQSAADQVLMAQTNRPLRKQQEGHLREIK